MSRVLPGVYGSIYDNSQLPEGQGNLTVGYVLACNRGQVGAPFQVTSPTDFLQKCTFSGKPPVKGDTTFTTILRVLRNTTNVYISRVAVNPLYGALVVKREFELGDIVKIKDLSQYDETTSTVVEARAEITILGTLQGTLAVGDVVRIASKQNNNVRGTVVGIAVEENTTIITIGTTLTDELAITGTDSKIYKTAQPKPITQELVGEVQGIDPTANQIICFGNVADYALQGDLVTLTGTENSNGNYTVVKATFDSDTILTTIEVEEDLSETYNYNTGITIQLYRNSLANPEAYNFKAEDLFLVYGKDQGAYNSDIAINIISSMESPNDLPEANTMQITVINALTGVALEPAYTCSRNQEQNSISGEPLYIEQVINEASEYVKILDNTQVNENLLPCDTVQAVTDTTGNITGYAAGNAQLGGGSDGEPIDKTNPVPFISALEVYADKSIPVSILGNGWCENELYQQAMLEIVNNRLDCFAFLNNRRIDEQSQIGSTKATNIVNYKKQELGSTTYMAAMYAPHVTAVDTINQRKVLLGAEAVAIPGWLNVITNQGYPYAYAGYSDGAVTGVTTDWKISDESGEAKLLNDASINYVAYDSRDGAYYMQCQNTLQIANSALRNIGTVLNILDIKETFMKYFKPFIQKPITDKLRATILNGGQEQVKQYVDAGRITDGVLQDVSSDLDISNNTLRYLLTIAPTPYAQVIYLQMNIVNQTYDFSILQSA